AVNKGSQMICRRPGCLTRRGPPLSQNRRGNTARSQNPGVKEDRPDPFWANRGEVGVPGLGLLDDKMSVGSLPPPTLNRHGEAQSRGATAKLIASSISRAVKQAEQGERPGQRQAPQAKGPVMARHQWESVLGEEEPAGRQAKASSGSAAGRAARNVSQIAATSRDRSRSRFPGS
ncbi:unnamed protein product, partial [Prorocentrum cordatum]